MGTSFKGFSFVEVLIATAVVLISSAAIFSAASNAFIERQTLQERNSAKEFVESLGAFLLSKAGCSQALAGHNYSTSTTTRTNLVIPPNLFQPGQYKDAALQAHSKLLNDLVIGQLDMVNSSTAAVTSNVNNQTFNQHIASILVTVDDGEGNIVQSKSIELPVLVDAANKIKSCGSNITQEDICGSAHGVWDNGPGVPGDPASLANGSCKSQLQCESMGTYLAYTWVGHPGARQDPRIAGVPANDYQVNNPITGSPSCPAEPNPLYEMKRALTGEDTWSHQVTVDHCLVRVPVVKCGFKGCKTTKKCIALDPIKVLRCSIGSDRAMFLPVGYGSLSNEDKKSFNQSLLMGAEIAKMNYFLSCLQEFKVVNAAMTSQFVTCQRCPVGL